MSLAVRLKRATRWRFARQIDWKFDGVNAFEASWTHSRPAGLLKLPCHEGSHSEFWVAGGGGSGASSGHASSVGVQVLSGLYRSISLKISSVFGPRSF